MPELQTTATATLDPTSSPLALSDEHLEIESPMRVAWRRFRKHKPGVLGLWILIVLYIVAIFADFIAPYDYENESRQLLWAAPGLRFRDQSGFSFRPFVHPLRLRVDENFNEVRVEDQTQRLYVRFFVNGDEH